MDTIELDKRVAQEVFEELKYRLESTGYLPDEYFLMDSHWEFPEAQIFSAPPTTAPAKVCTWMCT